MARLLHDLKDFPDLIAVTARDQAIDPGLVEKDYWIMHCLWGLQQLGMAFELKGGTSLSKGYQLIHRFSEDIDILIHPPEGTPTGKNHNKEVQVEARRAFFDALPPQLLIPGVTSAERDHDFDDHAYMRSAGVRLRYRAIAPLPEGVKEGILLEAGFDQVSPNQPRLISSWAYDKAVESGVEVEDNRARDVACYEPGYTLVEKLQTISTKFRKQQADGALPVNFLRHYYDVHCLLADPATQAFIGTEDYLAHKARRFRKDDEPNLRDNPAFTLADAEIRELYAEAFEGTRSLYYRDRPSFADILARIEPELDRL
ncbi:nucleotidyl transferase AbiEii/AbiGii toxin family protein [Brevundimonas sp. P7753]|uniref:nucleotidyl transferase AbiEii/AbiGii toxin family protein n=1 Tax=Brevundimonas sp. P7753 TaxID=2726982 RepID=UPI0015BA71E5|nr:nucleotidyl transferase AbiEii/AbiGii toxin family protein [Brevundimonas sp. P7753]NWE51077.1 nucleotidyl transferase AbiEii/AbiGii toxin family protein [Brevundimonas sp. P7753]